MKQNKKKSEKAPIEVVLSLFESLRDALRICDDMIHKAETKTLITLIEAKELKDRNLQLISLANSIELNELSEESEQTEK
ncbi:MAG: hypothetical protein V3V33_12480 [Candidatus Lokiarchaeia archaeon]